MKRESFSASRRISTLQPELQLIPEYKPSRRPQQLPMLHPTHRQNTQISPSPISHSHYSPKHTVHSSKTIPLKATNPAPLYLPPLKTSPLAQILQNRRKFIKGYFDSIDDERCTEREDFHKVKVGEWVVYGRLEGRYVVLTGVNEDRDKELKKRYLYQKVKAKVEGDYGAWVNRKFAKE